ncbi:histidine phosphatase superfamily-domain-containing protein [Blyttiomyces helicus]|uniref:Inositol hexakisphosphate and diphosphoinositol-pentakisphosphate kinase n=1 Tax=Blyttiomyces helicus TaxID=388810 RepID=A0A4P9WEP1_9FUNG|nr:histidine phosphatase superfamily-domain-containing protein [Blyttiomyces helicus]|eukprot:RKO90183.1 histidine phosphatase superfamily-domain-containing protein [Blyttiomyces helicus]
MPDETRLSPPKEPPASSAAKLSIGVCAMDNKARSKPMRNILNRLLSSGEFDAVIFGDKVILDEEIDQWPSCDVFISFFSTGFPLQKAIDYVKLRKPFCVNDLPMQQLLWDRRLVLAVLDAVDVPTPRRLISSGGHPHDAPVVSEDMVARLKKLGGVLPAFGAEQGISAKMVDADTIEVGGKTLKKPFVEKPVSGEDHNINIYFPESQGGGARRLFRKVGNKSSEFCPDVTEVRTDGSYIYEEFMQVDNAEDVKVYTIGTEYAHAETRKSPVVDGIVRRNSEGKEVRYVTALSPAEREMARRVSEAFGQTICGFDLLRADGRSYVIDVNGWSFVKGNDDYYNRCAQIMRAMFLDVVSKRESSGLVRLPREMSIENQWRLKTFLSVLRHGDRTPKQKVKFIFRSKPFMSLLNGGADEVVLKKPEQLRVISAACVEAAAGDLEDSASLDQLQMILDAKADLPGTKAQIKPSFNKVDRTLEKMQLIVKWGGEFTHGGLHHSKDLGENLRKDLRIINKELLQDVKIYTSSERRVVATADIFCKAFLNVPELPDDFLTVRKEMLDDSNAAKEQMESVKTRLQHILNPKNPMQLPENYSIPGGEEPAEYERWEKLFKDFCDVELSAFEPSKVSELYDSLKYDLLHNREFCEGIFASPKYGRDLLRQLYSKAKALYDLIAPQEYGIEDQEKLEIGMLNSQVLLKQLVSDAASARSCPHPATRLYFTKESKVISLLNIVRLCGIPTKISSSALHELDYLTQITFEVYERNRGLGSDDPDSREYSLRIGFSQGAHDPNLIDLQLDSKHSLSVAPRRWISDHISLDEALNLLTPKICGATDGPKAS